MCKLYFYDVRTSYIVQYHGEMYKRVLDFPFGSGYPSITWKKYMEKIDEKDVKVDLNFSKKFRVFEDDELKRELEKLFKEAIIANLESMVDVKSQEERVIALV